MFRQLLLIMMASGLCCYAGQADAQEDVENYAYGVVIKVAEPQLVVRQFDYDKEQDQDVTYTIDGSTLYRNCQSLKDVGVDDTVEVYYVEKGTEKLAKVVAKENMLGPGGDDLGNVQEIPPDGSGNREIPP